MSLRRFTFLLLCFLSLSMAGRAQRSCETVNTFFKPGEEVVYEIYYNWGLIWVNAGQARFTVTRSQHFGKGCFKLTGKGNTYPKYDYLYKVRDTFESWVDSVNVAPYRYIRDTYEGSHKVYNDTYFSYSKKAVYGYYKENNKPIQTDTLPLNTCVHDVMSMIYYARTLNFAGVAPGESIPFSMYLDNKVYALSMKYLGKEKIRTDMGEFSCIKFKPRLIPGTMFKEGDEMTVWVSDDDNRVPLLIEAPILVGNVKARIKSMKGLRNPVTSIIAPASK